MGKLLVVVLVLSALLGDSTRSTVSASAPTGRASASVRPPAARADLVRALAVVRDWDVDRAQVWRTQDTARLRLLYVPGSAAGHRDVRLLRRYRARGVVVRRLVTQVFAVTLLRSARSRVRVRILDRVAGGVVSHRGRSRALRSTVPTARVVEFRRSRGEWRVAWAVSGSGRGLREARR